MPQSLDDSQEVEVRGFSGFHQPNPDKPEITNYNIQILSKIICQLFGILNFGHCDLFGICDLLFGIF
jgi:hypothetical protein